MKVEQALAMASLIAMVACSGAAPESTTAPSAQVAGVEGRPASAVAPARAAPPSDPTDDLRGEILRVVGQAACRDDSQCRALPLGSKPCGGPEGYIAWSTAGTDARQLEALAARYKEARTARNQRSGLMSDCAVLPEPTVRCVPVEAGSGGRCQAVAARGGPSAVSR